MNGIAKMSSETEGLEHYDLEGEIYREKVKSMNNLIETGILAPYEPDEHIDMDDPLDWQGTVVSAIAETGRQFSRLERIAIMEVTRQTMPDISPEHISKIVNAIVREVKK